VRGGKRKPILEGQAREKKTWTKMSVHTTKSLSCFCEILPGKSIAKMDKSLCCEGVVLNHVKEIGPNKREKLSKSKKTKNP